MNDMKKAGRKEKKKWKKVAASQPGGIKGKKKQLKGSNNSLLRKVRNWL